MQKTFEVQGPAELDVRLQSGDIEVDPSADGRVEVELIAYDEESQRLVDDARVELSQHGHRPTVVVDVPQRRGFALSDLFGRGGIQCRIRCPYDSSLSVRTKSAHVLGRGTLGALAVNVGSVAGDIRIGEAHDNVTASSVSGDQEHLAVMQGVVAVHSVSGDLTIGVRRGSSAHLDCTTVSGDSTSELELSSEPPTGAGPLVEIRAKTVSGDIRITRAPAPVSTQEVQA
jgi:hypothetical protein